MRGKADKARTSWRTTRGGRAGYSASPRAARSRSGHRAPVRRRARGAGLLAFGALLGAAAPSTRAQTWSFHGGIVDGGQLDVVRGPNDRLHVVSTHYYQIDATGAVLVDEAVGDEQQCGLCFPPAIAVGDDGTVHLLTRHAGDMTGGYDLRYQRRSASGTWDQDYLVGGRVGRNYVVGLAWAGAGQVYLSTSEDSRRLGR